MAHYVYAVAIEGDSPLFEKALKIGIASDPSSRLSSLQTGSPFKMVIKATWKYKSWDEARDFERACHEEFKDRNILREWFTVTVREIDSFNNAFYTVADVGKEASDLLHALRKKEGVDVERLSTSFAPSGRDRQSAAPMGTLAAATYIGVSASWLNKSRMTGTGPVYMKNGGKVRYSQQDLENWLAGNRRTAVYDFANKVAA